MFDDSRMMLKRTEARRAPRRDVIIRATLREHGSTRFDVTIHDLSVTGYRFDSIFRIPVGGRVWITFPGLESLESLIAWHREPNYGAAFTKHLHPAVLDHIVKQFG